MELAFSNLCRKNIVSLKDGSCLGRMADALIDASDGKIAAVVVPGRPRLFGLLGREEDLVIPLGAVDSVGRDVILVNYVRPEPERHEKTGILEQIFS